MVERHFSEHFQIIVVSHSKIILSVGRKEVLSAVTGQARSGFSPAKTPVPLLVLDASSHPPAQAASRPAISHPRPITCRLGCLFSKQDAWPSLLSRFHQVWFVFHPKWR